MIAVSNGTAIFRNRADAARRLLDRLSRLKGLDGIVLAVPRGGIPMGRMIADALGWPLESLWVKKLGHPDNPEYAIGAVTPDDYRLGIGSEGVSRNYIDNEVNRLQAIMKSRSMRFVGSGLPTAIKGKIALVIDDGIATGKTLEAGIYLLRKQQPASIIIAVPVAPPEAIKRLSGICDQVICLEQPEDFVGVGQYYLDFRQVEDDEVEAILKRGNS